MSFMKNALLTMIASAFLVSCSKDDDTNNNGGASNTDVISSSAWKFDDAGADADKNGTIDISFASDIDACLKDNTLTLSANGSGTVDEGATKCDPQLPQTSPVSWSFSSNETSLVLGGSGLIGITGQFKIVTLNNTNLALAKDTVILGNQASFVVKLKH
jgi:hypothetical protein